MTDYVFNGNAYNTRAYDAISNPGGLDEGGFRINMLPMMEDMLADASTSLQSTSLTSRTIGTGAFVFTLETWRPIPVGAYAYAINDATHLMFGQVTARDADAGTITLTVAAGGTVGAGTFASWTIQATAPQGTAGIDGSQIYNGVAAPDNGDGENGDYYFRTNGGVYAKAAGAWSLIFTITAPEYWNTPRVIAVGDSPVTVLDKDILLCRSGTGAIELDSPATGRFLVVDVDGSSPTYNIVVDPPSGETILDGAADENFEIDVPFFAAEFMRRPAGTNWSVI